MPERESRTTSSSPRASSSSGSRQTSAPSYLSPRSADVILSEVRPTRIKSEALRSVNVLLDELLWLILGYARSFATDRLRLGLLKILPTGLGKDALLEAEVELRAYIERNPPLSPLSTDESTMQKFPLQPAFELLRVKCEAYSSLGDQTENAEVESALHSRMVQVAGDAAPRFSAVAPAALYLTAILEHICEHVLSNVGQVVARDSSRTTAHAQDLYVALCEDESIYSLFKTMKVQDQIEQQAKTPPPRRSKSISRNDIVIETPSPEAAAEAPVPKPRQSLDSAVSNGSNSNLPNRTSMDKARNKILFKTASSRSLADGGNSNSGDVSARHRRSNSLLGGDKKYSSVTSDEASRAEASTEPFPADDDSTQDFDDLMRSGTTMKVSLTPDRLKTFEVFAKEKIQRANRPGNLPSSPSSRDTPPPSSFSNGVSNLQKGKQQSTKARKRVESIAESPEDQVRSRSSSITTPVASKEEKSNNRARSLTETRPFVTKAEKAPSVPGKFADTSETYSKPTMPVAVIDPSTGMPKRTNRGPARRRESLDLEDIMDGSDDDSPTTKKLLLTPKSAQATTSGARDLMEFLSEGPPEPPPDTPLSSGPSAYDPQRSNKGRFRTIVSRLTGSTSNERLSARATDDGMDATRRSSTLGVNGGGVNSRPPLNSKRSVPNVAIAARPTPQSSSTTLPSQIYDVPSSPPVPRVRQPSLSRKAVPNWDSRDMPKEKDEPSLPPKASPNQQKPLPDPTVPSPAQSSPVDSNGTAPSSRRRVPRDLEQSKDSPTSTSPAAMQTPSSTLGTPAANGHAKAEHVPVKPSAPVPSRSDRRAPSEQEPVKSPSVPSRSDRRVPTLTLSIPSDELTSDLRRLMARATTADECRVLMEMFLAKCGASREKQEVSGPITPPMSPVSSEIENRHESNLIEILLGDGPTAPMPISPPVSAPVVSAPAVAAPIISAPVVSAPDVSPGGVPTSTPTAHTHQPVGGSGRRSPQPRSSPIITPAPSPVATATA